MIDRSRDYTRELLGLTSYMSGLPAGHIPGSISVPFAGLLDPETKALLPREELRKVFKQRGVDPDKPIITSCGTGVTAAVLDAALEVAGIGRGGNRKLYDGSWTYVFDHQRSRWYRSSPCILQGMGATRRRG